jgi:hypothetical protein
MKKSAVFLFPLFLMFFCPLFSQTAKRLYFTTNMLESGPSIQPGFNFLFVFSGIGQGGDGCVYAAIGNTDEGVAAGDMCVAEYNPYANTMRSVGTVVGAYKASGNWVSGEYCNKVHTWFCGTPDGKVWFGSEDGGRGGHLLYVDPATRKIVDHSRQQKYIYLSNNSSANPRYMWTESYPDCHFQVWDLIADTTRAFTGGHRDMRAFVSDRKGNLYYGTGDGHVYRRSVNGRLSVAGTGIGYLPNTYCYSHSCDTAFTLHRTQGELAIYDFVNATARLLANLPDGSNGHQDYRAMTVSRNGRSLYVLGGGGDILEVTIATGQHRVTGNIRSALAGDYAMSSGSTDSLGNWYIICTNYRSTQAFLLQVNLGKDKVTQLPMPEVSAIENIRLPMRQALPFMVRPNPFGDQASFFMLEKDLFLSVFDPAGRLVWNAGQMQGRTVVWNAGNVPVGHYIAVAKNGRNVWIRKIVHR